MKLSWHFKVMADGLEKVWRDFSFSSQATKLSLKAAAATCLSVYLALLLNFENPFFAGFGCFLMLLPNASAVFTRALQSIAGAIVGGFLGYIILGISVNDHFAFTIAVFIVTAIFSYLMTVRKRTSFFWYYALINLLLAALAGAVEPSNAFSIAFFRVVNVTLGICCYVLVSVMIFPDFAEDAFLKKIRDTHGELCHLISDVLGQYLSGAYTEEATLARMDLLEDGLTDLGSQIDDLKTEERILGASKFHYEKWMLNLSRIAVLMKEFYEYASSLENRSCAFQKNFAASFEELIGIMEAESKCISEDFSKKESEIPGVLSGFDSEMGKETYSRNVDKYETEDVLLFLECLLFCRTLVHMDDFPDPAKDHHGTEPAAVEKDSDEYFSLTFFGHRILNIDYMTAKFSTKSALAVIADFWIYFWFEIPGSATSIAISAITVTRPDIFLTRHRSILRMTGCLAGVFCSFAFLAFGVQTTSIMFACFFIVAFVSGLIWCGDVGIAYFGFQMLLAFMFSVIPNLAPAIDVTEPVQRAVAVVIGVVIAWIVMTFVFPDDLVAILHARLKNIRGRLKTTIQSVSELFTSHSGEDYSDAVSFSMEEYNPVFSLLLTIRGHMEISESDACNMRLYLSECMKIHRSLKSISAMGNDGIEHISGIDPGLCNAVLSLVSDAISPDNGIPACDLGSRILECSARISTFEKVQRDQKLLRNKDMELKIAIAHFLLSLRRMLGYAKSILPLRNKGS